MSASKSHWTRYLTLPTHGYYKIKVKILLWVDFFVPYDKRKKSGNIVFYLNIKVKKRARAYLLVYTKKVFWACSWNERGPSHRRLITALMLSWSLASSHLLLDEICTNDASLVFCHVSGYWIGSRRPLTCQPLDRGSSRCGPSDCGLARVPCSLLCDPNAHGPFVFPAAPDSHLPSPWPMLGVHLPQPQRTRERRQMPEYAAARPYSSTTRSSPAALRGWGLQAATQAPQPRMHRRRRQQKAHRVAPGAPPSGPAPWLETTGEWLGTPFNASWCWSMAGFLHSLCVFAVIAKI
jgi:hypothetical protein